MFNIGPLEFLVLAGVALIVFGPDKLPQLAKDAGKMLRTLRDLAQGARMQLNDELGPTFADLDLTKLNPRTAIRDALLGDDDDFASLHPREILNRAMRGEDEPATDAATPVDGRAALARNPMEAATPPSMVKRALREGEPAPIDPDTT